jgi:hypothetical protein|nr:MAG TPA: hypothetical protein [Caudoviricetes sp.]
MKKYTKNELKAQIVELSIAHHRAGLAVARRRHELNEEYSRYFRVHGDPEPNYRGIRWDDPRYDGVIEYTNDAYAALKKAKQDRYSAKRRLDTAVRRLMILTGVSFAVPAATAVKRSVLTLVRRSTACGETLQ